MPSLRRLARPLANRQFALLWSGQSVSLFGDGVFSAALPILVLVTAHGSAGQLGIVIAARVLPLVIFLLPGGAITDRVSRRLAMLTSDVVRGTVILILGVVSVGSGPSMLALVLASFVFGTFDALFMPAASALLPEIVSSEDLIPGNSLNGVSRTIAAGLIGPMVGGAIAAFAGAPVAMFVDAATFAISAICLALMSPIPNPAPRTTSVLADVRSGLAYCRRTPWLFWGLIAAGIANAVIFAPEAVLLPLMFRQVFDAPVWMIGVGFAAGGLGGLIGAVIVGSVPTPRHRIRAMWLCWIAGELVQAAYGLAPSVPLALVALAGVSPLIMIGDISWRAMLQQFVPRELLGRVRSVDLTISLAGAPIGIVLAGGAAQRFGIRATVVVPALVVATAALAFLSLYRPLTEYDRQETATAG